MKPSRKKPGTKVSAEFERFARFAKSLFAVPKKEVVTESVGRRAKVRAAKKVAGA